MGFSDLELNARSSVHLVLEISSKRAERVVMMGFGEATFKNVIHGVILSSPSSCQSFPLITIDNLLH